MSLMLLPIVSIPLILLAMLHVRDCLRWNLGLGALLTLPGIMAGASIALFSRGQDLRGALLINSTLSLSLIAVYGGHPTLWVRRVVDPDSKKIGGGIPRGMRKDVFATVLIIIEIMLINVALPG